ncbi:putative 26S proteasome non-ATPase regulatory subunit 3 [Thelohanellus kitauei]|uniref:Putative 26S proteasome non-ATPase regulatory subunit 3 n=1 Tax=Thelohanellus kitauei TaxID=669202 RepID=A0A0C2J6K7_THEKT|nr:putative 26S proteasome non-ATPase regulatory subunit 3 [Thelohanellus kitauei]
MDPLSPELASTLASAQNLMDIDPPVQPEIPEKYQELNDNQRKLHRAICDFCKGLCFDLWDDKNHASRAIQCLPNILELMDQDVLNAFVDEFFSSYSPDLKKVSHWLVVFDNDTPPPRIQDLQDSPNHLIYCLMICLHFHMRLLINKQANKAVELCLILIEYLKVKASYIFPLFSAKMFILIAHTFDEISKPNALIKLWFQMLNIHELLHYEESCATLINLILRSYINNSLWSQAESFSCKCKIPENASNAQQARFSYYCGMISLVHCRYREAVHKFSEAFTCSQNLNAIGLKQACVRSILISKLLLGEYPDRKLFVNDCYFKGIVPYFDLIKAVKLGSNKLFTAYITENSSYYIRDRTAEIVMRLHHNVLQAALVKLSLSYSSISLVDIAKKIQLEGNDVEFVVAKAIKENIIRAEIDHCKGIVNFTPSDDYYHTNKSLKMLQSRSAHCQMLYRKFIMAMTYPKSAYMFEVQPDANNEDLSEVEFVLTNLDDDLL